MIIERRLIKVNDIIQLIVNNGIGVVCVAYMIYFQMTTMKDMNKTLNEMTSTLKLMNQDIEEIKNKVK